MKKRIALLLAGVMLLTMAACGGATEPAPTAPATTEPVLQSTEAPTEEPTPPTAEPPAEQPTEPAETLPAPVLADELLKEEGTQVVTFGSLAEYEELLHELGYTEVRLLLQGVEDQSDNGCKPVRLIYNDKAFRFEFKHPNFDFMTGSMVIGDWILYGETASESANISEITFENYLASFPDTSRTVNNLKNVSKYFCYVTDTTCLKTPEGSCDWHTAMYYPHTGHLYNYVGYADKSGQGPMTSPILLAIPSKYDNQLEEWAAKELPMFIIQSEVNQDIQATTPYYYEENMTLLDWYKSDYSMDKWFIPDGEQKWLQAYDSNAVIAILYNEDGTLPSIAELIDDNNILFAMTIDEARAQGFEY